jgi:hypothetical protein
MTAIHPRIVAATKAQLAARPNAERRGFKAAFGIAEIEELIGSAPVVGHLTTATEDMAAPATHADVESNVMHRAFALGPTGALPGEARLIVNGEVRASAPASAVEPGDHVVAEIDGLGRAALTVAKT